MERLSTLAMISVGRGCGFAALAITLLVLGLSFDPVMAAKTGAMLTTGLAVILLARAHQAPQRDYRKTELWIMLGKDGRPVASQAQRLAGQALKDAYMAYANLAAQISVVCWIVAIGLWIVLPPGFQFD